MGVAGFLIPVIYNIESDPLHPAIQATLLPQPVAEAG
jgi:hypothetical protein